MSEQQEELQKELDKVKRDNVKLTQAGLRVREENDMLKSSPDISIKKAEFEYQLLVAKKMIQSGAFPKITPEQAWVQMRAGQELGLSEMESMTDLYIVNGSVQFHSKGLPKRFTSNGYRIEYLNETNSEVTVRVYNDKGEDYSERVTDKDQIIMTSKAAKFAKKNKMRYHGLRMIGNFYLPHLFGSVASFDKEDVEDIPHTVVDKDKERAELLIKDAESIKELEPLEEVAEEHELTHLFNQQKNNLK